MTADLLRAAMAALMASSLGACAMAAPAYPIREAAAAPPPPPAAAPSPEDLAWGRRASATTPSNPDSVRTLASAEPERSDLPSNTQVVQTDLPPIAGPAPAVYAQTAVSDQAPIAEEPASPGVAPPVNRRPGFDRQPAPVVHTRGSRGRKAPPAPPPAAPPAHPLVAGRVENVNDLSHTIEVEKGDTVNTISDGLMTPKDALIKANRLKKPYELEVGRVLKIPVHKAYVVQPGDSLYGIARRFSTPVDVLSDLNRLDAKSRLRPGQKVALPELAKDVGPSARPGEESAAAKAEEPAPPTREASGRAAPSGDNLAAESESAAPPAASSTARNDYSAPSAPRPYSSLGGKSPTRGNGAVPPSRSAYPPAAAAAEAIPPPSDSQIQTAGRGRFIWPVRGDVLSGFGPKPGGQRNDGVDIAARDHSPVRAAASGDVVYSGDQIPGFGNLVLIKHEGGWVTAYAHLSLSEVKIREHVSQGDEIGQVGQTGGVDQPQLHFEIRYAPSPRDKARPIDPSLVLASPSDD